MYDGDEVEKDFEGVVGSWMSFGVLLDDLFFESNIIFIINVLD